MNEIHRCEKHGLRFWNFAGDSDCPTCWAEEQEVIRERALDLFKKQARQELIPRPELTSPTR